MIIFWGIWDNLAHVPYEGHQSSDAQAERIPGSWLGKGNQVHLVRRACGKPRCSFLDPQQMRTWICPTGASWSLQPLVC